MYKCRIEQLTRREDEVLALILKAKTVAQIAETLYISPHTVHDHIANVCRKHGINGTDKHGLAIMLLTEDVQRLEKQAVADDARIASFLSGMQDMKEQIQGLIKSTKNLDSAVEKMQQRQLVEVTS